MNVKIYLLGAALLLSACSKTKENTPAEITVDIPEITLPADTGGEQTTTATFTTTAPWSVETSDSKAVPGWVDVSPVRGDPGTVTLHITAEENDTPEVRTAYVRILTGGISKSISITQPGDGTLPGGESVYEMEPLTDTIAVKLRAGSGYRVEIRQGEDWVTPGYISKGEKFDSLAFFLKTNNTMEDRTARIRISDPRGDYESGLTILQPSAALDIELSLQRIRLPTGSVGSDDAARWVDSLFVAAFDDQGNLLFTHDIPQAAEGSFRFRTLPSEAFMRDFYPSARIYVVANSSHEMEEFSGAETDFLNLKDTAASKLFGSEGAQPPLSGKAVQELRFGKNEVAVNLAHVTAQVTFNVLFDTEWSVPPAIEKLSIAGFSSWGYLFPSATDSQEPPKAVTFNPSITPNGTNQYLFFAYEESCLVLTARVAGRYYQGIAPDILKRGYKYTFNMRLCEDGNCTPSSETGEITKSAVPSAILDGEQTIYMKPL